MSKSRLAVKIAKGIGVFFGGLVVLLAGYLIYASATAEGRLMFANTPYPKIASSKDADLIERGKYLVHGPAHCSQCHSTGEREHPELIKPETPLSGGLEFAMGPIATTYSANLTPDPATGLGKRSDEELARTLRTAVMHDGQLSVMMRFACSRLSDEDVGAVISYLRSMAPVAHPVPRGAWGLMGKAMLPLMPFAPRDGVGPKGVQPGPEPSLERGGYLVEQVSLCADCHTTIDMKTFLPNGPKAGGGNSESSHGKDSEMEYTPPNLTSDPETGFTGQRSEDEFVARLRTGRAFNSSIMPWENFSRMTESDMRSVYRYLKSLPPVKNDPGPSYRKAGWKSAK